MEGISKFHDFIVGLTVQSNNVLYKTYQLFFIHIIQQLNN